VAGVFAPVFSSGKIAGVVGVAAVFVEVLDDVEGALPIITVPELLALGAADAVGAIFLAHPQTNTAIVKTIILFFINFFCSININGLQQLKK
jgi:hypothetical protein